MQINLRSKHISRLTFSAILQLSNGFISRIRELSPPDKNDNSAFIEIYSRHRAWLWVSVHNEEENIYRLGFTYEAGSRKLPRRYPRISQLINILCEIKEKQTFDCTAILNYGKKLRPKSIISLPMKWIEAPNLPFDRIQGLHLVKFEDNGIKHEVYLEAPSPGLLFMSINFKYRSAINDLLLDRIVSEAVSVSDMFVFKETRDVRKT